MFNNTEKPKRILLLILSLLVFNTSMLIATVRYVSHSGSNTPPYTSWATAADSIMSAINISVFGDTIYVANGVYKERIDMIPGLTLIGAGMDSCIIDTRNFPTASYTVRVTDSCYFAGFQIITYDNSQGVGIYIYDVNIENTNAIVEENKITEAKDGIRISSSSLGFDNDYKLVKMNIITNVQDGITSELTNPIIIQNIIYSSEDGLVSQINSLPSYLNNTVVLNNPQMNTSGYEPVFHIQSLLRSNSFYIYQGEKGIAEIGDTIINNVITGNPEYGMWTSGGGTIKNNIITGAQTGVDHMASTTVPVFQYNNLWGNEQNYKDINPDSTNIQFDPMFVNEDSMDLHLQKYSPLIDAGDPSILDKDSTRSDIGLYGGPYGESYTYLDLPPRPPVNLTTEVDTIIKLRWNRNTEADFNHYNLYRDTVKNFTIDSTKLVASLQDTFYLHLIPQEVESLYFKVTAVDNQGNESNPSEEVSVILVSVDEEWQVVNDFVLYQNYPNPFNPSTKIGYRLKERGYVKLYVYDIKGELVSTLVNQFQDAGYYEVEFNGTVQSPKSNVQSILASGIYIYQVHVIGENNIPVFTDIKKMILLR
jgi:hypothetical protein